MSNINDIFDVPDELGGIWQIRFSNKMSLYDLYTPSVYRANGYIVLEQNLSLNYSEQKNIYLPILFEGVPIRVKQSNDSVGIGWGATAVNTGSIAIGSGATIILGWP